MRHLFIALVLTLGLSSAAAAQEPVVPTPTTAVGWDPDPAMTATTHYTLYADDAEVARTPDALTTQLPFPALTPGTHTLEVTATNPIGESVRSMALQVLVIVTVPNAPTNLRIITARWTPATGWVPVLEVVRG